MTSRLGDVVLPSPRSGDQPPRYVSATQPDCVEFAARDCVAVPLAHGPPFPQQTVSCIKRAHDPSE